jgi:hypothetical protein
VSAVAARLDVWADGAEEPTLLEVKPRDVLAWEKDYPRRSAQLLSDDAWKLEYLYEVAFVSLGKPGDDLAKWSASTDVLWHQDEAKTTPEQESDADPTSVEASTGP